MRGRPTGLDAPQAVFGRATKVGRGMTTRAEEGPQGQRLRRAPQCRRLVGERIAIGRLCGDAVVAVVQTADLRRRDDASGRRRRNGPRERRVLVEREMRARVQVVREHPLQPSLVRDDHVIQALSSDRPDNALDVSILPGRARRGSNGLDVQAGDGGRDTSEDCIAIVQEIRGRLVVWESIAKLLRRPGPCRMLRNGYVNDPPTLVGEDDEHEEHSERDSRHDEEVDGHDLARVVRQERSPRL